MPKRRRRRCQGFVLVEGSTVEDEGREDAMRSLMRDYQSCGIHSYEVLSRKEFEKRHRALARADAGAAAERERARDRRASEVAAQDAEYLRAQVEDAAMVPERAAAILWHEMNRRERANFLYEKAGERLA